METRKIHVLGTEYTMKICGESEDARLIGFDGLTDETTKELLVESYEANGDEPDCKKDLRVQNRKVRRHEIIHAFLFESGLAENSGWAQNEEMVDFFAIQFPKLLKAFEEAEAL